MREYPVTVPNVFRINSNTSNVFEIDHYQNMLKNSTNDLQDHCYRPQYPNHHNNHLMKNGDLSNKFRAPNNNGTHPNQTNKSNGKGNNMNADGENGNRTTTSSYSLLDAITNVVTTGNCSGTIYPLNDSDDTNYFNDDKLLVAAPYQQQQQPQQDPLSLRKLTSPLINPAIQLNHNRPHHFPSVNYKNSYLLWIGTPVAARYLHTLHILITDSIQLLFDLICTCRYLFVFFFLFHFFAIVFNE